MKRLLIFLLAAALLCGCGAPSVPAAAPLPEPEPPAVQQPEEASEPAPKIVGTFVDQGGVLPAGAELAMMAYMDLYYGSLAALELCPQEELTALFAPEAALQAVGNHTVWDYLIQTRQLQNTDLSMTDCRYTLTLGRVEELETGAIRFMVEENSLQHFAAHPEVDSEVMGVRHIFEAVPGPDGWYLTVHMQLDSLYFSLFGDMDEGEINEKAFRDPKFQAVNEEYFTDRLNTLLAAAEADFDARWEGETAQLPEAVHPYDRQAVVDYAHLHAQQRSEDWADYGRYGGNCQNYASQCLLAGGIPMDISGNAVWKWYGTTPNGYATPYGRSASWSSVESFRDYARRNRGYGLAALVDAPYYSGQPGDLLEMGLGDAWKHTVIITGLVADSAGNTVDYLVDSNTADLRNYPAGAYSYTKQSLVRIAGWNG